MYVPIYNPSYVYGPWWYPAYPPYAYYPPGYVAGAALFSFGVGVAVGAAWGYAWGGCNWRSREVNIDINRIYQSDIVTLRTFEVAACGGFLIAEANEEVASLFRPDEEIVLYESVEELHKKVRHFLLAPEERQRIAAAFHARFMKDHRLSKRLGRIFKTVGLEGLSD